MKNFDAENKALESVNSKKLVSTAERLLRARIAFAGERLTIIKGMILQQNELKVKGVSPAMIGSAREEFNKERENLNSLVSKKYNKNKANVSKIISRYTQASYARGREGNLIQP